MIKKNIPLLLVSLLLITLVLITFRKSFDNEFVDWDDFTYVVDNALVRNTQSTTIKDVFTQPVSLNYHPLTILSLRMNNNTCKSCPDGISPAPFIRWNVIIHIMNTLLVFVFIYLLTKKNILVAFLVAVLFGVHPMHVESVAWVSERKDVLYSFFFLSGLITYFKYLNVPDKEKSKYFWLAATFILFILSCLSKAMAVVFPLVLLLIKFWSHNAQGDNRIRESIKETFSFKSLIPLIPFFIISLFFGIMAISINNINSFTFSHRIQYASYGFIMYIVKFFVPLNLAAFYPYPTQAEYTTGSFGMLLKLAPFALLLISGLVVYSLKKTKLFVFGVGFFLVTVMMVLQFISVGAAIMADRYSYLSYVGLAFIPAVLIGERTIKKRAMVYVLSGCFIILMMILSQRQIEVWSNSETLWTKVLEKYPNVETARSLRGNYYYRKSARATNVNDKVLYEGKAFEDFKSAIKANTPRADVYEGAGCIYGKKNDLNNALACFNKTIQIKPKKGSAYFNRAITLGLLNKNDEAIKDYTVALVYYPQRAFEIITNRSNLFLATGRYKEAITDLDYLISVDGRNFLSYYNRAFSRQQTNDIAGAVSDYQKAAQLQPDDQMIKIQLKKLTGK
jgi:tetratricopeptide (TPR) repeat protein